jgi:hypothetical protein
MCQACLAVELYFASLGEPEEGKKAEAATQPRQGEGAIIQGPDDAASAPAASAAPKPNSRFVCDEPE